jgi:hypothetical protein
MRVSAQQTSVSEFTRIVNLGGAKVYEVHSSAKKRDEMNKSNCWISGRSGINAHLLRNQRLVKSLC